MIEPNVIGGSPESVPGSYAPESPLLGWPVVEFCVFSERITLEHPVVEMFDGTSVSPVRKHRLIMN